MPHAAQCTVHKKPASPLRFFRDISAKVISSREALLWTGRRRNTTNAVNSDKYWVVQDALLPFFHFVTPFNSADEKTASAGSNPQNFHPQKESAIFPKGLVEKFNFSHFCEVHTFNNPIQIRKIPGNFLWFE